MVIPPINWCRISSTSVCEPGSKARMVIPWLNLGHSHGHPDLACSNMISIDQSIYKYMISHIWSIYYIWIYIWIKYIIHSNMIRICSPFLEPTPKLPTVFPHAIRKRLKTGGRTALWRPLAWLFWHWPWRASSSSQLMTYLQNFVYVCMYVGR